jgi:putative MATE family efflux protein
MLIFFGAPLFMRWMGAEGIVHTYGTQYLSIRSFEMIYLFVFGVFTSMRQATGDTKTPVFLSIIALILNIILTPIFIFNLKLEVIGAAYATLIANLITFPIVLYFIFHPRFYVHAKVKDMGFSWNIFKNIMRVGLPATAGNALSSFGFVLMQSMILGFGITTAAAFSVGNRIYSFFLMPAMSLGSVLSSYIGQNMGAGNVKRAKEAYDVSRKATLVIMSVIGAFAIPFVRPMASLLSSGETLKLASEYLVFLFLTQPFMAIYNSYCGVFDGSGNTRLSFLMHTIRLWVFRIPVILVLREFTNLGSSAIWICMLLSNFLIAFVGYGLMKKVDFGKTFAYQEDLK